MIYANILSRYHIIYFSLINFLPLDGDLRDLELSSIPGVLHVVSRQAGRVNLNYDLSKVPLSRDETQVVYCTQCTI